MIGLRLLRTTHNLLREFFSRPILKAASPRVNRNVAIYEEALEIAKDLRWHGPNFNRAVLQEAARLLALTPWQRVELLRYPPMARRDNEMTR